MSRPKAPPYLAFELDALPNSDLAALSVGLDDGASARALLRLWEHAWREQVEWVRPEVLLGCCKGNQALADALAAVAFGFLEPVPAGWTSEPCTPEPIPVAGYRVRGARRYLRIGSPQSLGGHAAKGNLIPGGPRRGTPAERATHTEGAETSAAARQTLGSGSAGTSADPRHQRTANSEQRESQRQHLAGAVAPAGPEAAGRPETSNPGQPPKPAEISPPEPTSGTRRADLELVATQTGKRREAFGKREAKTPDPRIRELSDRLVATYKRRTGRDYVFQGAKDGRALVSLVEMLGARMTMDDIDTRAGVAFGAKYKAAVGIADFASRINEPAWGAGGASVRAEDQQHSAVPGVYHG